jgi:hypothetical protein
VHYGLVKNNRLASATRTMTSEKLQRTCCDMADNVHASNATLRQVRAITVAVKNKEVLHILNVYL